MLPKPYYESKDGRIVIYCGDALAILPQLGLSSAVCVTDPPFGVRDEEWDDMDELEFARFSMQWLSLVRPMADECISFCSAYGPFRSIMEMLYPRVRVMIWDKPIGSQYGGSSERGLWFAFESIYHGYTKIQKHYAKPKFLTVANMIRQAREAKGLSRGAVDMVVRGKKTGLCYRWEEAACLPTGEQTDQLANLLGLDGEFRAELSRAYETRNETIDTMRQNAENAEARDVFTYRTITNGRHPCEKPVGLMMELIGRLVPADRTIIEPFAGSGSTIEACKRLRRKCVAIEVNPEYCEIAVNRLAQEVLPLEAS